MTIPLAVLLLVYLVVLAVFAVQASVNAYHLLKFGVTPRRNRVFFLFFSVYSLLVLVLTGLYCLGVDWGQAFAVELPNTTEINFPAL